MPWFGLLLFLQKEKDNCRRCIHWCQCPGSGYSYFYEKFTDEIAEQYDVSMPWFGLLLFLLGKEDLIYVKLFKVSMPWFGLLLFLLMDILKLKNYK